jgi:threonine dehydratase
MRPAIDAPVFVPPAWQSISEAHKRIAPRIHRTPVFTSVSLDKMSGAALYLKCENFQKTGSFKIRGAANAILSLTDQEASRGIITHSSGNHGAAVACAAGWRKIPAWIVMPENCSAIKCRAVESYGGKIIFCEPTVSARAAAAAKIQSETGAMMIHPYDNDQIIAGQATAAKELLEDYPQIEVVLAPVSGGGLLSGTCLGAKGVSAGVRVFGCEPGRADDAYRSMMSGMLQTQEASDTIADGLRASLAPRTFAILRRQLEGVLLVSEEEIMAATRLIWERMKMIVEPSSAIAVAPLLRPGGVASLLENGEAGSVAHGSAVPQIGIILSGGNVDLSVFHFT